MQNKIKLLFKKLVEDKIIIDVMDLTGCFFDEPSIFHHISLINPDNDLYNNKAWEYSGTGVSSFRIEALSKALIETIEKYSLYNLNYKILFNSVKKIEFHFLHPGIYRKCYNSEKILKAEDIENKIIGWEKASCLTHNIEGLVPAQLIHPSYISYMLYEKHKIEPCLILTSQVATGSAGGFDHESTLSRAIYEVIERDAVTNYYLAKFIPRIVDIDSIAEKSIQIYIEKFHDYNFEVLLFDLTTDLNIPVYMAMLIDLSRVGPIINLGFGAGLNINLAIKKSIEDAFQSRIMARRDIVMNSKYRNFISKSSLVIGERRFNNKIYLKRGTYELIHHILGKPLKKISLEIGNKKTYPPKEEFELIVKELSEHNLEIWYKNIVINRYKKLGLFVYKAIIPGLQLPIYNKRNKKIGLDNDRYENVKRFYKLCYEN